MTTTGTPEDTAHFALDKVELAIEQDDPTTARAMLRAAAEAYTRIDDPVAYTNAMNRFNRMQGRVLDAFSAHDLYR